MNLIGKTALAAHGIIQMETPADVEVVRGLVLQYTQWLFDTFPGESDDLHAYFSPDRLRQALDGIATGFLPPAGTALVARVGNTPVGCVLAHPIGPGIAEMKRLFVVPAARGTGIGRALIEAVVARMGAAGYATVRLDTAIFLTDAIALYRRTGFIDIPPYFDVPAGAAKTSVFMERRAPPADG